MKDKISYNISFPKTVYDEIKEISINNNISISDVLRQFVKLGLIVNKVLSKDGNEILIRENGKERSLFII